MATRTMKAVVVVAKGKFEIQEREIPKPGRNQVLVKVLACGVCHTDAMVFNGFTPLPRVPGHEVVGIVEELGEGVSLWKKGDRVGAGYYGGNCFSCRQCRKGDFVTCAKGGITGVNQDGGYAEYFVQPQEALGRVPEGLDSSEAAPLMCAGVTMYNSIRRSGVVAGDLVAIQGLGGLGHLGILYCVKMGFRIAVLGRGEEKREHAKELGAHIYVNMQNKEDPGFKEIEEHGGVNLLVSTAPAKALKGVLDLMAVNGKVLCIGVDTDAIPDISPLTLLAKRLVVTGWPSGNASDWEDTMEFAKLHGIRSKVKEYPLEQAAQAFDDMMKGTVGRGVLVPGLKK